MMGFKNMSKRKIRKLFKTKYITNNKNNKLCEKLIIKYISLN